MASKWDSILVEPIRYELVVNHNHRTLVEKVNEYLRQGAVFVGAPGVNPLTGDFYQGIAWPEKREMRETVIPDEPATPPAAPEPPLQEGGIL